jgi:predicted GNAT superfamily acetyltransferase
VTPATRDLVPADLAWMVPLNNAAVPAVPPMDAVSLGEVLGHADLAIAVVDADAPGATPVGMLLAMQPGGAYDSPNYRWFAEHGVDGLYVDRIVVADGQRGRRLGQVLYARVFAEARRTGRASGSSASPRSSTPRGCTRSRCCPLPRIPRRRIRPRPDPRAMMDGTPHHPLLEEAP